MGEPIRMIGLGGLGEIQPGDDLAGQLTHAARAAGIMVASGDILVVAQKVVSKAEGRILRLETVAPSDTACRWAAQWGKDPRAVEAALKESRRIVRMDRGILITETHHGFVCANAGVDSSNAPAGCVTLLPLDCDRSAAALRERLEREFGATLGVIISDSFGRPWREGLVNVALGVAGVQALVDCRGQQDSFGRNLQVTVIAAADELAAAAELVMGKTRRVPAVVIQGFDLRGEGSGKDLVRAAEADLFR